MNPYCEHSWFFSYFSYSKLAGIPIINRQQANLTAVCQGRPPLPIRRASENPMDRDRLNPCERDSLMDVSQKIADIMIPLDEAAIVTVDTPLKDVIQVLRKLYCEVEEGKCTEAGFRAVLVLDEGRQVVGIVDFQRILEVLVPEITGNFPAKVHALWDALGTLSKSHSLEDPKLALRARIMKNAEKRVSDVMLGIKATIKIDADVLEALMVLCQNKISMLPVYDAKQPVGVVRDSDLFLRIAAMVHEPKRA